MFGAPKQFGAANPFGQQQQQNMQQHQQQQQQQAAPSAFGKTTSAFGQPAFGQQNTSLFGSSQPQTGGIFGSTAAPTFGATAAPAFGQVAPAQPAFGSSFGAQPQTNSLFGQNAQANNSLFGQSSTSAFGAAKPPGFGFANTQQSSLFGQPATSTPATGFGSNTFGGTTTSAFGQPQAALGANGTAIAKYQPHSGTDTLVKNGQTNNVNTRQHCITAMKEYEAKSLEELRIEDYTANRKGPQAGSIPPSGGLFGSAPQNAGLFGASASQPQTGLFGQQQPATNTLGGFGQQQTSAFGAQPSAFGQNNTSAFQSSSLFGKPAATQGFGQAAPAFGQTQPAPSSGLFGSTFGTPATSANTSFGGFGAAPAANTTTPFGAAKPFGAPASGSLFGQTATTSAGSTFGTSTGFGGFGATSSALTQPTAGQSLFGGLTSSAQNSTGFGGFGAATNTAAGGGLFGQKPATGFGQAPSFGAPSSSATTGFGGLGSFGTSTTSGFGSFGQQSTLKPAATTFTGFGAPAGGSTFSGGLSLGAPPMGFGAMNTTIQQPQQTAVPIHQQILSIATSPYGDNPIFKDLKPLGSLSEDALKPTNPAAQKAILEASSNHYKISPKVGGNGLKLKPVSSTVSKKSLFGGLEEFDSSIEENFSLKTNAKRLVIKPKASTPISNVAQSVSNRALQSTGSPQISSNNSPTISGDSSKQTSVSNAAIDEQENNRRSSWLRSSTEKILQPSRNIDSGLNNTMHELFSSSRSKGKTDIRSRDDENTPHSGTPSVFAQKSVHFSANDSILSTRSILDETNPEIGVINTEPHPTGITLTRPGYYTIPPLEKLTDYIGEDGSCIVPNFTIGRKGYGNVYFGEPIDVAGLNLDELVHFRHKEVIIYPDDENKPPIGQELNRKAQITLDQVWPHDKTLHEPIKDRERLDQLNYEGKLRAVCDKNDTRFVEYRPETGSWVFKVDHFSKYGLSDSDEDDVVVDPKNVQANAADAQLGIKKGAVPKKIIATAGSRLEASHSSTNKENILGETFQMPNDLHMNYQIETEHLLKRTYPETTSPSAELAMDMDTNAHKLQLMKASLFVDDDYDAKSVTSDRLGGRDSPDQIVPSKRQFSLSSLLQKDISTPSDSISIDSSIMSPPHLSKRDEITNRFEAIPEEIQTPPIKLPPLIIKPKVAIIRAGESVVPLCKSILAMALNKNIASDSAFFNGRRFKIGWSHSNKFTMLSTANALNANSMNDEPNILFDGRNSNDHSKAVVRVMNLNSLNPINKKKFQKSCLPQLKCRLKNSRRILNENSDCPQYVENGGAQALLEHYQTATRHSITNHYDKLCVSVWSLCLALWGEREELEDIRPDSHISIMLRRDLFSEWLESVVTEKDLLQTNVTDSDYLDHLWKLLTAHKVNQACDLAFDKNDVNLSLLLAQLGSSKVVRALVLMQMESWRVTEADKFIANERLKAMMLVGGIPYLETSNGELNLYGNLDWLKSIAITIWYLCSPTASVTDALLKYESTIENYAVKPLPPYKNTYDLLSNDETEYLCDIRYHILKLYSRRSHPMEKLLNPATHTSDLMDFRLSWQLLQVLKGIGYTHCSEQSEVNLHISFASQLENYDLWHWSVFVLLHIPNQAKRELSIQEILYRYIEISNDNKYIEKESFIVNELGVPEKWIYWAKAVRAGAQKNYHAQADYLLKAKQWAMAHEVIMVHIAPDAIINENSRYIKDLLDRFEDPRQVPNWSNQGMIILDYLDITAKLEALKTIHERDIESRWEGLKPQLSELCSRINLFPCPTSKHRLCQSEIAQGLAVLVNGMEILCNEVNPCVLVKKALEKLPLPEEFAKQQVRALLDNGNLIEMLQAEED